MFSAKTDLSHRIARSRATAAHMVERAGQWARPVEKGGRILHATVEYSFRCNLRCFMCSQWGDNGVGLKMARRELPSSRIRNELTLPEWKRVVDQLVPHRSTISMTGGEVFIRSDAIELIEYASSRGLDVTITSNGTLIDDELAWRIGQVPRLRGVNLSLDGDERTHDEVRGAGNFQRTLRAARIMAESKRTRRPEWGPMEVRTSTVLLPGNHGSFRSLASQLKAAGVDQMGIAPLRWFTQEKADQHFAQVKADLGIEDFGVYGEIGRPMPADFPAQATATLSSLRQEFGTFVYWTPPLNPEFIARYHTDLDWVYRPRCTQMYRAIRFRADGNAIFCPAEWLAFYFLGNVKTQTVDEIWQGTQAKAFRRAFYQRTQNGAAWAGCARCCVTNRDDA